MQEEEEEHKEGVSSGLQIKRRMPCMVCRHELQLIFLLGMMTLADKTRLPCC